MSFPKRYIRPPKGYVDKYGAAAILQLSVGGFVNARRSGTVKLPAPKKMRGSFAKVRHYWKIEDVIAEAKRRGDEPQPLPRELRS